MRKEFGQYLRELREERGISARSFAKLIQMDASNFSKIERGEVPPPSDAILGRFAEALGISVVVDERWYGLKYRADVCRGELPDDVMKDDAIAGLLPAFFAHIRKEKPKDLEEMYSIYCDLAAGRDTPTGSKKG